MCDTFYFGWIWKHEFPGELGMNINIIYDYNCLPIMWLTYFKIRIQKLLWGMKDDSTTIWHPERLLPSKLRTNQDDQHALKGAFYWKHCDTWIISGFWGPKLGNQSFPLMWSYIVSPELGYLYNVMNSIHLVRSTFQISCSSGGISTSRNDSRAWQNELRRDIFTQSNEQKESGLKYKILTRP